MKAFVAFLLSCASLFAQDTNVCVTTSITTNSARETFTVTEVFTRAGQTNLVRQTTTERGVLWGRVDMFYRDGERLAARVVTAKVSQFHTDPNSHYSVSLYFSPSNELKDVSIFTNGCCVVVDGFAYTNGVCYPHEMSRIREDNAEFEKLLPPKK
jgi:hypothetical protein